MTWLQHRRVCHNFTNSIWILPSLGMIVVVVTVPAVHRIEEAIGWEPGVGPDVSRAVLAIR